MKKLAKSHICLNVAIETYIDDLASSRDDVVGRLTYDCPGLEGLWRRAPVEKGGAAP
jgi:hypothetical protein